MKWFFLGLKVNKTYRALAVAFVAALLCFAQNANAGLGGPKISTHPYLSVASATGSRELLSNHKAIQDDITGIKHNGQPQAGPNGLLKAFDENAASATGNVMFLSIDLGDDYVVDSSVVNFAFPVNYAIGTSIYYGPTLAPTYNLTTGIGDFLIENEKFREFHPLLWVEPPEKIDKLKLTPTVCRFMWFHFHAESATIIGDVNEIQIYGHKYTPNAGDLAYINRSKWTSNASSCNDCGEGFTGEQMYDWLLSSPHKGTANPNDWKIIDMHESVTFTQASFIMGTNGNSVDFYANNDSTKWGNALATLTMPNDTATVLFPNKPTARYLKFVTKGEKGGWWLTYDVNLLVARSDVPTTLRSQQLRSFKYSTRPAGQFYYNFLGQQISTGHSTRMTTMEKK